jgi:importin-5
LTVGEMESFTNAANAQLKEYYEKLQQRELAKRGPDYDEDDEILAEEEEAEEAVLGELARAVHVLFQLQATAYLPFFEKMLPIVTTFLGDKNSAARQWAVCILDDLVEFCGPISWNYRDAFLEKWFACVVDEAADVRQAAAYGVGIAAQCGGPDYAEACAAALNNLFQVINHADARLEENIYSTENCISAVSKICKFNTGKFDTNVVLPAWLDALPIVNDEEEAPLTYTYLLDLIDA